MNTIATLSFTALLKQLPAREHNAHKANFGHVLIIGGDIGYAGAPLLAALGALRVGAGLVTLASHQQSLNGINACHPEIMCRAITNARDLKPLLDKATVVAVGPGLGRSPWSHKIFKSVINTKLPLILDADALFFLAQAPTQSTNRILTPHPGEAANLLGLKQAVTVAQRHKAMTRLIAKYQATIVLKGAATLIGSKKTSIGKCTAGNPGMATAGMGDLLTGVIAGLVAQGLELDTAAKLGVCVHAMAGDLAAKSGARGIIATDLLLPIKQLMS